MTAATITNGIQSDAQPTNLHAGAAGNAAQAQSMSAGPLFVVGMWRSGTSLLYALLNQNPQIGLMYESDIALLAPLFRLRRKSPWWLHKVDSWNGVLTRHKINPALIPEDITNFPDAFAAVAQQYAQTKGATIWGCKSPSYYDCMTELADWFPEAKFIVIWRDPADVLRSIVRAAEKSPWFARPGMDLRALLGYRRMKREADELVRRGAAIDELQYDDLVNDPENTIKAICEFIGIEFDPHMATLEGADRSAIYNGDHHSGVKSSSIVAKRDRPEVLSPALKGKIERYVVYWQRQSGGVWPVNAEISESVQEVSWSERSADRFRHALLRLSDEIVPFVYTFVPVRLWKIYRQVKSSYQNSAAKTGGSAAA